MLEIKTLDLELIGIISSLLQLPPPQYYLRTTTTQRPFPLPGVLSFPQIGTWPTLARETPVDHSCTRAPLRPRPFTLCFPFLGSFFLRGFAITWHAYVHLFITFSQ